MDFGMGTERPVIQRQLGLIGLSQPEGNRQGEPAALARSAFDRETPPHVASALPQAQQSEATRRGRGIQNVGIDPYAIIAYGDGNITVRA